MICYKCENDVGKIFVPYSTTNRLCIICLIKDANVSEPFSKLRQLVVDEMKILDYVFRNRRMD